MPVSRTSRPAFLPFATNVVDRVFIAVYLFVALELFWLRFLESTLPLGVCHILAVILGGVVIWRG